MEIIVRTKRPSILIESIEKDINDGELKTWEIKKNNKGETLFNHIPDQWSDKALLKPYITDEKLTLKIAWWDGHEPEENIKGYILGRFIEVLMVHYRDKFSFLVIR